MMLAAAADAVAAIWYFFRPVKRKVVDAYMSEDRKKTKWIDTKRRINVRATWLWLRGISFQC